MRQLNQALDYLKRCNRDLTALSKREHINLAYLWLDFASCSLLHGAILNHYTRGRLYADKGCQRKKAMTYGRILRTYKACNSPSAIPILNSKHLFNERFAPFIKREWLWSKKMELEQFLDLCSRNEYLIIKPEDGVEGIGIERIYISKNNITMQKSLYNKYSTGSFMIEECIKQHPEMAFNNTSVNTVRAHSIIDREGNVHLLKMLLRVGVGDSVVDNYAHGGCVYELDAESGHIISPSLMKTGEQVYIHPGSEIFVLGRQVPNWEQVKEGIRIAHKCLPDCRFIGWDVAVTADGIELIEGNHNPDYELLEFFGSKGWFEKIRQYI